MQKHVNLVDLVKSFPTNIYLQNLASIQKRTSRLKFAHLAGKSEKGSVSNLSTKAAPRAARRRRSCRRPGGRRRLFRRAAVRGEGKLFFRSSSALARSSPERFERARQKKWCRSRELRMQPQSEEFFILNKRNFVQVWHDVSSSPRTSPITRFSAILSQAALAWSDAHGGREPTRPQPPQEKGGQRQGALRRVAQRQQQRCLRVAGPCALRPAAPLRAPERRPRDALR